jgi:hypothetical protein
METGSLDAHRAYLERGTADPHQMPVFGVLAGEPFLYAELYWVAEDHIAPYVTPVAAQPWDRGFHILVGSEKHRGPHRVQCVMLCWFSSEGILTDTHLHPRAWLSSILHYLFLSEPRTQRVLMEPRASNSKIIDYMCRAGGFCVTKHFDFPHKRSALLELTRERFFQLAPFHWEGEVRKEK